MFNFEENSDHIRADIERRIAELDALISIQLNEILQHEEFRKLEASWRGLFYLVNVAQPNNRLRIKVLHATKKELLRDAERALEFQESRLFKLIYDDVYDTFGAAPFGMLIGDYEFGIDPHDIALLENLAPLAAFAACPFISGTSPDMFGLDNFTQLSEIRDLSRLFYRALYAKWRSFRESPDSRFVGLTLPKVLMPETYQKKKPYSFNFQEEAELRKPCWINAAYAFGACVANAYRESGWCGMMRGPESDGLIEGINGLELAGSEMPVETIIYAEREKELADRGFIPAVYSPNRNQLSFYSAQSCHQPKLYETEEANLFARRNSQLPYVFAMTRFAHYLKALVRDRTRAFADSEECQAKLRRWISQYFSAAGEVTDDLRHLYPLAEYMINVRETPDNPGEFEAIAFLRPIYLLEDSKIALRMAVKLPKNQGNCPTTQFSADSSGEIVFLPDRNDPNFLKPLEEPNFEDPKILMETHSYRFFFLPGFSTHRRLIRVDIYPDWTGIVTVKVYEIFPRDGRLHLIWHRNETFMMPSEQVRWYLQLVEQCRFWEQKNLRFNQNIMDGSNWMIEAVRYGNRQSLFFNSPKQQEILSLGAAFFRLGRFQTKDIFL